MNKKLLIIVISSVVLLGGIFYAISKVFKAQEAERVGFMAKENFQTFVPDYSIKKGNPEAKVYVVEFFDPECESCRKFHPYMHTLMEDYKGKIQVVMRYAAFHQNSIFAIKILEAARKQNKYWEALEILFQHQPEWGNHHNPRPELLWDFLPRLGIDIEKIKADMDDASIQKIIDEDAKAAELLEVRGTPTFFVNGKPLEQYGPEYLKQAIERELSNL